jgi:hypothetical protein
VRINSNKQVKEYDLDSMEKRWKKSKTTYRGLPCGLGKFPCIHKDVIFENQNDWDDFMENIKSKNKGKLPIRTHRILTMSSLSKIGKRGKKIPEEFRLYNVDTGEIFDLRELYPDLK